MLALARKIFGSSNERRVKGMRGRTAAIGAYEPTMQGLSDEALRAKTVEFRKRLADGAKLDDLVEEAFAVVREAGAPVVVETPGGPEGQAADIAWLRARLAV